MPAIAGYAFLLSVNFLLRDRAEILPWNAMHVGTCANGHTVLR